MGWDAFAHPPRKRAPEWKAAADAVRAKAGVVDGLLYDAGLDCSACARALEEATGRDAWDADGWSAVEVKRLAVEAFWPKDPPEETRWAVESARAFLNTCAKLGVGIKFSW
jgi:hypothetical protein